MKAQSRARGRSVSLPQIRRPAVVSDGSAELTNTFLPGVRPVGARGRPAIYVAAGEFDRLAYLAQIFPGAGPRLLAQELDRAMVVDLRRSRRGFVRLGSTVTYLDREAGLDRDAGQRRTVTLVVPSHADPEQGKLSVTSPAGAALIGLSVGDVFGWRGDDGRPRELTVLRVENMDQAQP